MSFQLPEHFWSDLTVVGILGATAIVLLCFALKCWTIITPVKEEEELKKNNMAVSLPLCVYIASIAYIIGQVIAHVIGS